MGGWPSPTASDSNARGTSQGNRKSPSLPISVLENEASWPTPRTTDTQAGRGCVQIGKGLYRPSQALAEGRLVGGANLADAVTGEGWPTPRTQDSKHGECTEYELSRDKGKDLLHVRIERESKEMQKMWPTATANCSTGPGAQGRKGGPNLQTSVQMWPTASARDWKDSPGMSKTGVNPDGSMRERTDQLARAVYALGQQGQDNSNSGGSPHGSSGRAKQWRTPNAQLIEPKPEGTKLEGRTPQDPQVGLADQVVAEAKKERETWPTPVVTDSIGAGNRNLEGSKAHAGESLTDVVNGGQKARVERNTGRLNPRWVETLMGVPVGWTMPSCTHPVIIEPTS